MTGPISTRRQLSLAVAAAALLGACGTGDAPATTGDTAAAATAGAQMGLMSDEQVAARVGATNSLEIATGEIARDKATDPAVKEYARDMVTEHQRLQLEADSLAVRLGMTPRPAEDDSLAAELATARQRLQELDAGRAFDSTYMAMQVAAHERALDLLSRAVADAQGAELRTLLEGEIPLVQQHLDRARGLVAQLGGGAP